MIDQKPEAAAGRDDAEESSKPTPGCNTWPGLSIDEPMLPPEDCGWEEAAPPPDETEKSWKESDCGLSAGCDVAHKNKAERSECTLNRGH